MHIEREIDIARAPAELWPFLTDPELVLRWTPGLERQEPVSEGPPGPGHVTSCFIRDGRTLNEYRNEILEWQPERLLVIELSGANLGKSPMRIRYELAPSTTGSRLRYVTDWQARGALLVILSPLITLVSRTKVKQSLNALKALAEDRSA